MEQKITDEKPKWDFKTPIEIARWLSSHDVKRIDFMDWHDGFGVQSKQWMVWWDGKAKLLDVPYKTLEIQSTAEVKFEPDYRGLVHMDTRLVDRLDAIDKWEAKNKKERRDYERLKKKFGDNKL